MWRLNRSGIPTGLATSSVAPFSERFRTVQSIAPPRNSIEAPLNVRYRSAFRRSSKMISRNRNRQERVHGRLSEQKKAGVGQGHPAMRGSIMQRMGITPGDVRGGGPSSGQRGVLFQRWDDGPARRLQVPQGTSQGAGAPLILLEGIIRVSKEHGGADKQQRDDCGFYHDASHYAFWDDSSPNVSTGFRGPGKVVSLLPVYYRHLPISAEKETGRQIGRPCRFLASN